MTESVTRLTRLVTMLWLALGFRPVFVVLFGTSSAILVCVRSTPANDQHRQRFEEVTKTVAPKGFAGQFEGVYLVVTWEWNNGFNLVDSRRATPEEIAEYLAKKG